MIRKVSQGDTILADDYNSLAAACQPWIDSSAGQQLERDGNTLLDTSAPFVLDPMHQASSQEAQQPWTWVKTVGNDGSVISGEWTNCSMQVGMKTFRDADVAGRQQMEDGQYYCQYDVAAMSAEVKRVDLSSDIPESQLSSGHLNFYVGTVKDEVQTDRIFLIPVVYLWL